MNSLPFTELQGATAHEPELVRTREAVRGGRPYLRPDEHSVLVVGAVPAHQEGVGPDLLQQVEPGTHHLVDPAAGLLGAVRGEAIGGRGSPRGCGSPTLKLQESGTC